MTAGTPGGDHALVAQAADAAHDCVHIGHLEGDMVEGGKARAGEGGRVVGLVAADEDHALRPVGDAEA